ncbi:MAG: hypothetical protein HY460_02720 [Parcubacteria group bacterium]|nr:hypothetical protein [Parcubacteria group bacterium]
MPPQTSQQTFIPRQVPTSSGARREGQGIADLIVLVSIVLFVASSALAAGVFLYGEYLKSSAASKLNQLERAKAAFEPSLIHELSRLDDRMRAAGDVLGRHLSLSAFFAMLEQSTIETISFTSLDFEAVDQQHMNIRMDGVAGSVNSIALQADLFSKSGMIASPIFSNIDREIDGVHFSLSAILNPEAVNYSRLSTGMTAQLQPSADLSPFPQPQSLEADQALPLEADDTSL